MGSVYRRSVKRIDLYYLTINRLDNYDKNYAELFAKIADTFTHNERVYEGSGKNHFLMEIKQMASSSLLEFAT